jgi:SAM-dependent methyltransferase
MLRQAAAKTNAYRDRLTLLWQDATQLPFSDHAFDAVTCLEALEFVRDSRATLTEMVRVLRPGGILLISNRTGPGVRWMPGRTMSREALTGLLETLSLTDVHIRLWQVDYDIAWARKPVPEPEGFSGPADLLSPSTLSGLLRCPRCESGALTRHDQAYFCGSCERSYPIADDGVIEMAI